MFVWDWITGALNFIGLFKRSARILLLGIDNSGKTSLLAVLRDNRLSQHLPTLHMTSEELTLGNIKFTAYDLGGHQQARKVWKDYFPAVDAIVFLIDTYDRERFPESKAELDGLLGDEQLSDCPMMIIGNKIDRPGAASEQEIRQYFGLTGVTTGKNRSRKDIQGRPCELFMCSVLKRQGYGEGFRWLSEQLN